MRARAGNHLPKSEQKDQRDAKIIKIVWPKFNTTKALTWFIVINAVAWVWFSYILAALDKIQIAESLSSVAVTSIIGVVFSYCAKAVFENLSKNNSWPDRSNHGDPPVG